MINGSRSPICDREGNDLQWRPEMGWLSNVRLIKFLKDKVEIKDFLRYSIIKNTDESIADSNG